MKKLILLFIFSCTSIKPDKPVILSSDNSKTNYSKAKINKIKKLKKGSLLVLVQNKRGLVSFTPDIKNELSLLAKKKYFTKVKFSQISKVDIKTINIELRKAKKKQFKYLLLISYYSNNSVSQAKLHTFLKTSTLNLYDLIPVFSPITNTFIHNYAFTLEASLIDVNSYYIMDNFIVSEYLDKGIKGSVSSKDINVVYLKNVISTAAKKLVSLL